MVEPACNPTPVLRRTRNDSKSTPRGDANLSHRTRALCIATVAIVAVLLPNAAWAQTRLNATVGPGFTISLRDASGANVTHLPVGTYEIAVNDQAIEHNFH